MRKSMTEKNERFPPRKSLTSLDVARRAGVSRTAISYVLNEDGVRSTHVSEETRAKVLQAVQELGYSTHSSARALRKGQSDEICIIAGLPLTIHRSELFVSVQQHGFLHGYAPVVYFSYGFSDEQLHSHLLERGHRHLGLVQPADPLHDYGFQQRLEGMRATIAGMPGVRLDILSLQFDLVAAHSLVETSFTGADRPSGIYAFNDEYALLLLGALTDRRVQVPAEVAVVGTDDLSFSTWMRPTLTTIRFDTITLAQRAIEMLVRWHRGQPLPEELSRPLMPQLIPRGST